LFKKFTIHVFVLIAFIAFCFESANAKKSCNPEDLQIIAPPTEENSNSNSEKNPVFVFFDGSLSMEGFVHKQQGQKNIYVDLMRDLTNVAETVGSKTLYFRFGKTSAGINESEIRRIITPTFYKCPEGAADCALDNQESRLEIPFKAWTKNKDATYIIVTDLFMSSKHLVAGRRQQLVQPIKSILRKGKSVAVVGIMSSFKGVVYDIPLSAGGTTSYSKAQQRPFYIIIIGEQQNIHKIKKTIEQEHLIDKGDNYKFALITSNPISNNLNVTKKINEDNIGKIRNTAGFKFEYLQSNLAYYQFDISRKNQRKTIKIKINNSDIIVPDSNGVGNYNVEETLWWSKETKCKDIEEKDTWRKTKFKEIGKLIPNDNELVLDAYHYLKISELFREKRYFHYINIYATEPGKLTENTFEDWNLEEHEAEEFMNTDPVEFKTLNLKGILQILTSVANENFEPKLIASLVLDFNLSK